MAENSSIEWTDHTWNPWIGCTKVSPGCDNCYAATQDKFRKWTPNGWGGERRRTSEANWRKPLQWQAKAAEFMAQHGRRQRVFCASLADWLDNAVPIEWLVALLDVVRKTPDLDWLLLSKRIGIATPRLREALKRSAATDPDLAYWIGCWFDGFPPANVWIGATITSQSEADRDIPKLLAVPARVRFLSMEPLLGPVDLAWVDDGAAHREVPREEWGSADDDDCPPGLWWNVLSGRRTIMHGGATGEWSRRDASVDWVIVGGESGPGARPMHPDWARSLRDQCRAAGVPFLFKQWGEWGPDWEGAETCQACGRTKFNAINSYGECGHCGIDAWMPADKPLDKLRRIGKKAAGRLLDGVEHNGFPGEAR